MNKLNYLFITEIAAYIRNYSQFPQEVCDWIGCQFAVESAFSTSNLAQTCHNYCGMKNPLVRISTAIHAGDSLFHWAQFEDKFACIIDYLMCLQYHRPISSDYDTVKHFAKFIASFYCPEKDYIAKINFIYSQFKNFKNE